MRENGVFRKIFSQAENTISLWESPADGNIRAGTFGNGVFIVNRAGKVLQHLTERSGLANGGTARQVWLATLGGVLVSAVHPALSGRDFLKQAELDRNNVYKVFADC